MAAQSRIGDIGVGICCCHSSCIGMTGPIVTGSSNTRYNGIPAARIADIVLGSCGHIGTLVSSSTTAKFNGRGAVRIGDVFVGCFTGIIIQGSPNSITGG